MATQSKAQVRRRAKAHSERRLLMILIALLLIATVLIGIAGAALVIEQQNQASHEASYTQQLHVCADIYGYKPYTDLWTNCMAGVR